MAALVVFVTVSNAREAKKIAQALVREKLAACVNEVPHVKSTYWWKGKIESAGEVLLIIKTQSAKFGALQNRIKALHSYTVPEIISLPIQRGNPDYLAWIKDSLR